MVGPRRGIRTDSRLRTLFGKTIMTNDATEEASNSRGYESHYIPGSKLPKYEDYCPLTKVWGYRQEDGTFLADVGWPVSEQLSIDPNDFVDNPGFLIVHLGHSVEREHTVEKAADALRSSMTSLFAACDIPVNLERIRTSIELSEFMKEYRGRYSNLILIGHGSTDGIRFLDRPNPVQGAELAGMLGYDRHPTDLQILSLCCHSGCKNISSALSQAPGITEVIAPSGAFDLRWAVHFVVGYFLSRFINSSTTENAIKLSCGASRTAVCIWRKGEVEECTPADGGGDNPLSQPPHS